MTPEDIAMSDRLAKAIWLSHQPEGAQLQGELWRAHTIEALAIMVELERELSQQPKPVYRQASMQEQAIANQGEALGRMLLRGELAKIMDEFSHDPSLCLDLVYKHMYGVKEPEQH